MPSATRSSLAPCSAQYSVKSSFWGGHWEVRPRGSEQIVYYVNCPSFALTRPSGFVHAGSSTSGRVVGGWKLKSFSQDIEVGIGDLNQPSSVMWERMEYEGVWSARYIFRVAFGSGRPQSFTWKRTHTWGSGGSGDFKLVNESQTIVAVFEGSSILVFQPGYLSIYAHNYGEHFNFMVLLTLLALKVATSRYSGGGGGGGGGGGA